MLKENEAFTPALRCIVLYLTNTNQGVSQLRFEIMENKKKNQKKSKSNMPKHSPLIERGSISEL